jgi:hypothetical protein
MSAQSEFSAYSATTRAWRLNEALKHESELTGHAGTGLTFRCEVDFYRSADAIPGSRDEPGEPAQYEVASIRAFTYGRTAAGFMSTERVYLETPPWLEEVLIDCIDRDALADAADKSRV